MKAQSVHRSGGGKLPKSAELIRADSWKGNEKRERKPERESWEETREVEESYFILRYVSARWARKNHEKLAVDVMKKKDAETL